MASCNDQVDILPDPGGLMPDLLVLQAKKRVWSYVTPNVPTDIGVSKRHTLHLYTFPSGWGLKKGLSCAIC